jgi:diguanylate cyclase (GGDEF)-like protein
MYSTGMVMEKLATRRLPTIHARQGLRMIGILARDPVWVFGFTLLALGLVTQVLALTLAPISIVQAVAACGIALFLVLSHFVLGERLTKFEYVGIACILLSLVFLGLSVDPHVDVVTGSTGLGAIFNVGIPAVAVGVALFVFTDRLTLSDVRSLHVKAPLFGLSSGLLYGVAALGVKEVSTIVKQYGLVPGVPRVLASPGFYLFLVSTALGFLVFQTALQRTTASLFVPVNNVTSSCYFIIAGTVLFHERFPNTPGPLALRLGAFMLILLGLLILSASRSFVGQESAGTTVPVASDPMEKTNGIAPASFERVEPANGRDPGRFAPQPSERQSEGAVLVLKEFSLQPADHDSPSGLTNPMFLNDRLTQAQLRQKRRGGEVVVCHVRLQKSNGIGSALEPALGKSVVERKSRQLTSALRAEDTVCRVGENEFVLVMTVADEVAIGGVVRRVQYVLDQAVELAHTPVLLRASLGVVVAEGSEGPEQILARAGRSTLVSRRRTSFEVGKWNRNTL